MVNLRRTKKKAILHGADVKQVEKCKSKVAVEKVLNDYLNSKKEAVEDGVSE